MPSIDDIAAEYVERAAALDPCYATYAGIAGHDHELPDLGADDAGDPASELNTINSWVQTVREVFALMPTDGEEAAANIAKRMPAVPQAYRQLSATLLDAARNGRAAARRQVEEVAGQCAAWAGRALSLKDFHAQALSLGAMGLDPLREALARTPAA